MSRRRGKGLAKDAPYVFQFSSSIAFVRVGIRNVRAHARVGPRKNAPRAPSQACRHAGSVYCIIPHPRARGSRSPIDNRILPRKIKETVLRSAPVSGKSLGPLLPHPSVDSLHRLVTSQMSRRTMGTQHKKASVAHFHALRLHRGSVKRTAMETRRH